LIRERFPDDAVLGEEFGELPGCSGRRWILDPIDGTKAFVYGVPLFGVLVGLEENDVPVLGVVYLPALEEMVYAARGRGCWWLPAGRPPGSLPRSARVTAVISLAESLVLTNSYEYFAKTGRTAACERLHQSARYSRGWADCYGHILVATGRAEVCVDPQMNIWDGAPLLPILTEAGGTFTDWKGQPTIRGGDGISTNGRVLAEVLRVLG
jgi:histidinol phosphatase-like enzyme (inositol monophosphatase family)